MLFKERETAPDHLFLGKGIIKVQKSEEEQRDLDGTE